MAENNSSQPVLWLPTNEIKWFRVDNVMGGEKPLAQIAGYLGSAPEWFCLKQFWRASDGRGEWRDVEVMP